MYKVFFKDRFICLHDDINEVSGKYSDYVGAYGSYRDLKAQLDTFFSEDNNKNLYIFHDNLNELYSCFSSYFRLIPAAGGLVKNNEDDNLVIFRRGKWDLPKGKPHRGEDPEQTAIREVEEECNIQGVAITRFITPTYHIYYLHDDIVLKKTDWYEMKYTGDKEPMPGGKEGITETRWLPDNQLNTIEINTYPAILEVFAALRRING